VRLTGGHDLRGALNAGGISATHTISGGLFVNGLGGDDSFASDDNTTITAVGAAQHRADGHHHDVEQAVPAPVGAAWVLQLAKVAPRSDGWRERLGPGEGTLGIAMILLREGRGPRRMAGLGH
jgi:hypothetical protein